MFRSSPRPAPVAPRARGVRRLGASLALVALAVPGLAACADGDQEVAGAEVPITSVGAATGAAGDAAVRTIAAADAVALVAERGDLVIIDVREPSEFAAGHVPGAVNLDFNGGQLQAELDSLDADAAYLLYCRSGNRSGQAAALMQEAGFTEVYDMGALADWQAAGGEVVVG